MGTVIKAGSCGRMVKRLETLALRDHVAEAQRIVRDGRSAAAGMVADARAEIERARCEAADRGYQEGYEKGLGDGQREGETRAFAETLARFQAEQRSLLDALERMAAEFDSRKDDLLGRVQHDALELALAVAERITKHIGMVDREAAVANVTEALQHIDARTDVVIRIHPADAESTRRYVGEWADQLARKQHTSIIEDPSVEPGGCVVESSDTRIDATIRGQFREAARLVLGDAGSPQGVAEPEGPTT